MEEYCPYCNCVTFFDFEEAIANNGNIVCEFCGKEIKACSICSKRLGDCDEECFAYNSDFEMKLEA